MGKRQSTEEYRQLLAGISEINFARLAAYIDGEGCISINSRHNLVGRMKSISQNLNLVISNTNSPLIDWLKGTFGGSVYFVKYEKCKHLGRKQTMRWQVNDRKAGEILQRCISYMIVKKPQAEIGLAFLKLKRQRGGVFEAVVLTEEEKLERAAMRAEIQRLNQHGGAVSVN